MARLFLQALLGAAFLSTYSTIKYDPAVNGLHNRNKTGEFTSTGGNNWLQYLSAQTNTTLLDFAVGSATINNSVVLSPVQDVVSQVSEFEDYFLPPPEITPWTAENALFVVWVGINDVGAGGWGNIGPWSDVLKEVFWSYEGIVDTLYNAGARKFLFMSIPPTNLTPHMRINSAVHLIVTAIETYNARLLEMATAVPEKYDGTTVTLFDTQKPFRTILAAPQSYGFSNNSYCEWYGWRVVNRPEANDPRCEWPPSTPYAHLRLQSHIGGPND
ncbi:cellulose-binding GDSL lipase/acylhydrolase, carbohydrate Esterase Family 16 protein [Pseudohyphozyma bogoriensis]|nr:cellulose-binding GDSL lipase/acylhydrolase, carbohydrate Esterase Family 16 protein [Pseudohyphozyma bogoriensis]